jgi:hypothetical protein
VVVVVVVVVMMMMMMMNLYFNPSFHVHGIKYNDSLSIHLSLLRALASCIHAGFLNPIKQTLGFLRWGIRPS